MKRDLITIAAEIRDTFRADVGTVVKRGNLLLEAKKQLDKHGAWLPWLDQNFSMDARTAQRSMTIAKFAAKYDTVSYLNLSLAALTNLAIGVYPPKVIKAVMAEAKKHPVSEQRLRDIAKSLAPTPKEISPEADDGEERQQADIILDGPPPELAPVEPEKLDPDKYVCQQLLALIGQFKILRANKLDRFANTTVTTHDLDLVIDFLTSLRPIVEKKVTDVARVEMAPELEGAS